MLNFSKLLYPCLVRRFLSKNGSSLKDVTRLSGYDGLCEVTSKAIELSVAEFKKILSKACDKKSLESFDGITDEKSNLFDGAERLLDAGFNFESKPNEALALSKLVATKQALYKVLTTPAESLANFSDQNRFEFVGQLLKSTWIDGELYEAFKDNDWCNNVNTVLRSTLPTIIGTGDLLTSLTTKVQAQMQQLAEVFKKNIDGATDKEQIIDHLAQSFSRPGLQWMDLPEFMDFVSTISDAFFCK